MRRLDPQLTNREVERDVLLLSECGGEGKLAQSGEEAADLLSGAIAHLSNGFHVYGHFIFVGAGRGDSLIVLRITHSLELSKCGVLLAIIHEGVRVTRSQDLVGFGSSEHRRWRVFLQETSKVNRVNNAILIALGADKFSVAGPYSHAQFDLRVVVLLLGLRRVDQHTNQILLRQVLTVTAFFCYQRIGHNVCVPSHFTLFDVSDKLTVLFNNYEFILNFILFHKTAGALGP